MTMKILAQEQIMVSPTAYEEVPIMAVVYQVEGWPPRVVHIDREKLPDMEWAAAHPGEEIPLDLMKAGDLVRLRAAWDDLEKVKQRRSRPLSF